MTPLKTPMTRVWTITNRTELPRGKSPSVDLSAERHAGDRAVWNGEVNTSTNGVPRAGSFQLIAATLAPSGLCQRL